MCVWLWLCLCVFVIAGMRSNVCACNEMYLCACNENINSLSTYLPNTISLDAFYIFNHIIMCGLHYFLKFMFLYNLVSLFN